MHLPRSLRVTLVALLALGTPLFAACSLSLNQDKDQCKRDADCGKLGASLVCRAGLCVADATTGAGNGGAAGGQSEAGAGGTAGSESGAGGGGASGSSGADGGTGGASGSGGGAGTGGSGGASGTAGASGGGSGGACALPAPTCPDNLCVPFDNCARLGLCAGATLPPLVAPPKP